MSIESAPSGATKKGTPRSTRRRTWFLVRLAIYVLVVAALFVFRGAPDWRAMRRLAPGLTGPLLDLYRRDYPHLRVHTSPGGTNQALEDLLNHRADVAFLYRPPTPVEQAQLRAVDGDTAVVVPVAVAGVVLISAVGADTTALDLDAVRRLLATGRTDACDRLYAPDPNEGLWDAARLRLGGPDTAGPAVVFLADPAAVAEAVARDAGACGLVSSFTVDLTPGGPLRARSVRLSPGEPAVQPTFANLVTGAYPLHHWLYVACRGRGGIEGAKFVTHLASDRGQRQILRTGAVPARQVAREIVITRDPPGN